MSLFLHPLFAEEGMTAKPVDLIPIDKDLAINNSMLSELVAVILIITVVQIAMRAPKLVPTGAQNVVEWVVEMMSNFLESLCGRATTARGFWFFGGLFVFIFVGNILGLVPGVGSFGYGTYGDKPHTAWNFQVTEPWFRGANANDNLTAAYAAIFFFMFFYWVIRELGFGGSLKHIFGSKVHFANPLINWTFIIIFFLVGWIEILSIFVIRPIAFTFRLFGNIYGGEYLLDSMYKMAPNFAWAILVPFYFYELLVAFVQAIVFFALTAAFTGMLTNSGDHAPDGKDAAH